MINGKSCILVTKTFIESFGDGGIDISQEKKNPGRFCDLGALMTGLCGQLGFLDDRKIRIITAKWRMRSHERSGPIKVLRG